MFYLTHRLYIMTIYFFTFCYSHPLIPCTDLRTVFDLKQYLFSIPLELSKMSQKVKKRLKRQEG